MENKLILESKSVNPKKATLSKILAFKLLNVINDNVCKINISNKQPSYEVLARGPSMWIWSVDALGSNDL